LLWSLAVVGVCHEGSFLDGWSIVQLEHTAIDLRSTINLSPLSYRAFRFPWKGQPSDDPAMVAERSSDDTVTLYASWNGATEVATWEVLAGPRPERLKPVGSVPRHGFETMITLGTAVRYVGVQAKDSSGRVLGTSRSTEPI
jgi:hypothetical protein